VKPGGDPVDVVVVTWNSAETLGALLDSLPAGMGATDWAVIVADNGSSDDTLALLAGRTAKARILRLNENCGFAAAANRALAQTRPQSDVLMLNPDVRLGPGAATRMLAELRAGEGIGIVGPRTLGTGGELQPTLRFEPSIRRALAEAAIGVRLAGRLGWAETVLAPQAYRRSTVADWISGAALLISRRCLAACGELDESFFLYSEDTEYALRAADRGFASRLAPTALVTHLGGESRTDPALWTRLVLNKLTLYRRRHGPLRAGGFWLAAVLRELRFAVTGNRASFAAARALLRRPRSARR